MMQRGQVLAGICLGLRRSAQEVRWELMLSLPTHARQLVADVAGEHVLHVVAKGPQASQVAQPRLTAAVRILASGQHEVNRSHHVVHRVPPTEQALARLLAGEPSEPARGNSLELVE